MRGWIAGAGAVVAGAGLSAGAWAQPIPGRGVARFEVAVGSAGPWSAAVSVGPGETVFVRATMGWESAASVHGWAQSRFDEVRFDGANATDGMSGAARVRGMRGELGVYTTPTGRALDASVRPEEGGVLMEQTTFAVPGVPWGGFDRSNPAVAFEYWFVAGEAGRQIRIGGPWSRTQAGGGWFLLYPDAVSVSGVPCAQEPRMEEAVVMIVPAPGWAGLVMMGLVWVGRRRGRGGGGEVRGA